MKIPIAFAFLLAVLAHAASPGTAAGEAEVPAPLVLKGRDPVALLEGRGDPGSEAITSTRDESVADSPMPCG